MDVRLKRRYFVNMYRLLLFAPSTFNFDNDNFHSYILCYWQSLQNTIRHRWVRGISLRIFRRQVETFFLRRTRKWKKNIRGRRQKKKEREREGDGTSEISHNTTTMEKVIARLVSRITKLDTNSRRRLLDVHHEGSVPASRLVADCL